MHLIYPSDYSCSSGFSLSMIWMNNSKSWQKKLKNVAIRKITRTKPKSIEKSLEQLNLKTEEQCEWKNSTCTKNHRSILSYALDSWCSDSSCATSGYLLDFSTSGLLDLYILFSYKYKSSCNQNGFWFLCHWRHLLLRSHPLPNTLETPL